MSALGRSLIFIGLAITAIGVLLAFADKVPWLGRLPGDVYIKRDSFSFYFPLTTSILISVVLSLLFYFFRGR